MQNDTQEIIGQKQNSEEEAVKQVLQIISQFKIDSRRKIASAVASFFGIQIQVNPTN